jgi:hypothetical protein
VPLHVRVAAATNFTAIAEGPRKIYRPIRNDGNGDWEQEGRKELFLDEVHVFYWRMRYRVV